MSSGELESSSASQLNQIINQLHQTQTNGYSDSRKRSLILESIGRDMKRSRSLSPSDDDFYEEQQRSIFQAANSPEPQIIGKFEEIKLYGSHSQKCINL